MRLANVGVALLASLALPAGAGELDRLQLLNQSEVRLLSEDLGAALSYKALIPIEPQGFFSPRYSASDVAGTTQLRPCSLAR